jgi:hypothetical protein
MTRELLLKVTLDRLSADTGQITVELRGAVVSLGGSSATHAQRVEIIRCAMRAPGVSWVFDSMSVAGEKAPLCIHISRDNHKLWHMLREYSSKTPAEDIGPETPRLRDETLSSSAAAGRLTSVLGSARRAGGRLLTGLRSLIN